MVFISGITGILVLFAISLIFPFLSFLLPVFKIRKIWKLSLREKWILNGIAIIAVGVVLPQLLIFYLGFFGVIEILYWFFSFRETKTFDKIVVIALAASLGLIAGAAVTLGQLLNNEELVAGIASVLKIDAGQFRAYILAGMNSLPSAMFLSSIVCVFLTYLFMDASRYLQWEISYWWLLLYIVPFFLDRFLLKGNYYIVNTREIGWVIFAVYGMKCIYEALCFNFDGFRYKWLFQVISVYLSVQLPLAAFIIGGIGAFDAKLLHFRKK
ncbi:MAG: hypothetical protein LBQ96_04150 [Fusobacteriaceae bacterium]|nr:hypothetical protein [Fusobacteriaceae bacterium]